jgi:hypothetical protein
MPELDQPSRSFVLTNSDKNGPQHSPSQTYTAAQRLPGINHLSNPTPPATQLLYHPPVLAIPLAVVSPLAQQNYTIRFIHSFLALVSDPFPLPLQHQNELIFYIILLLLHPRYVATNVFSFVAESCKL